MSKSGRLAEELYKLWEQRDNALTFLIGLISLAMGYYLESTAEAADHQQHLLIILGAHLSRDVGIALFVGLYLSVTLERRNKRQVKEEFTLHFEQFKTAFDGQTEFYRSQFETQLAQIGSEFHSQRSAFAEQMKSMGSNLIKAIYANHHDPKLFSVIEAICDTPFYRHNYKLNVYLRDCTKESLKSYPEEMHPIVDSFLDTAQHHGINHQQLVVFSVTTEYTICNISPCEKPFDVVFSMEKYFAGLYPHLTCILQVSIDETDQLQRPLYDTGDVNPERPLEDPTCLRFRKTILIPAGGKVPIRLQALAVREYDDHEYWTSKHISNGIRVSVHDENGDRDVSVSLRAMFPSDDKRRFKRREKGHDLFFSTDEFLLPYQGIMLKWAPRPKGSRDGSQPEHLDRDTCSGPFGAGDLSLPRQTRWIENHFQDDRSQ